MVPQPHRPADLIIGGANSLGQMGQDMYKGWEQQQPGDPILDAYINRVVAGEDPAAVAEEAKNHGVYDMLRNKIMSQGGISGPQGTTPDLGWQGNQPTIGAPGSTNPAGGPQGPMGGPQGSYGNPVQGGGLVPPPPSQQSVLGGQPKPAQELRSALHEDQRPMRQGQVSIGQMGSEQPFNGLNVPSRAGGMDSGLSNTQVLSRMAQPIQGPQVQASTAPQPAQQPRPQAQSQQAPQQPMAQAPAGRTVGQQQRLMGLLPSLVAANSRTDVARIKADADRDRVEMTTNMRGLVALMRQNGADDDSIRKALTAGEGLDVKAQIAFLNAMTSLQRAQIESQGAYARTKLGTDSKGSNDHLKTLNSQINALQGFLGRMGSSNAALAPDGSQVTRDEAVARLRQLQQEYERLTGTKYTEYKQPDPPPEPQSDGFLKKFGF